MSGVRKLAKLLILCVIAPATLFAAIEGIASVAITANSVRAAPSPGNFRQARYDTLLGWVGLPGLSESDNYGPNLSLTTNEDGMRIHRPVAATLSSGQTRAICSGDSFTFGSGVSDNETFCAYLEQLVPGLETLNMAQRGYGIDQAYLWYKRDATRYPHQLHLFAFIWNDFERMAVTSFTGYPKPRLRLNNDALVLENVPVPQWSAPGVGSRMLRSAANLRLVQLFQRRSAVSEAVQVQRIDDQVFPIAEVVFRNLQQLNTERGSKLVLVYLPSLQDLSPGPLDKRRARIAAFAQAGGFRLIDLTEEIRTVPQDSLDWMFITPNALPVDGASGHYTAMGHKWVANRIEAHLRTLGLTDGHVGARDSH